MFPCCYFITFMHSFIIHTCIFSLGLCNHLIIHSINQSFIHSFVVLFLFQTRSTVIKVTTRPDTWSEYRIVAVNQFGSGEYSSATAPIYIMPNRPAPPRDFRIVEQIRRKDTVSVKFAWSKPLNLGMVNIINIGS